MTTNGEMGNVKCAACGHEFTPWGEQKFCQACGAPLAGAAPDAAAEENEPDIELSDPRPVTPEQPEVPRAEAPRVAEPQQPRIPEPEIPESRAPVDNRLDAGSFQPPAADHDDAIDALVDDALDGIEDILDEKGNPEVVLGGAPPRPAAPSHTDVSGNVVGGAQQIKVEQEGGPGSTVKAGDNVSHGDQKIEVRSTGSATSDYNVAGGSQELNLSSTPGVGGPVKVSADGNVVHGDQTVHITQVFGAGSRFGLGEERLVLPVEMKVGEPSRMSFTVKNTGSVPIETLNCNLSSKAPDNWAELRVTRHAPGGLGPSADALFEAEITPLSTETGYVTFHWEAEYLKDGVRYEYPFETHRYAENVMVQPGSIGAALSAEDYVRLEVLVKSAAGMSREALVFSETLTIGGEGKTFQKRDNMLCLTHPVDPKYISSQAADVYFEAGSFRLKNFHRAVIDGREIKKYKTQALTGSHEMALGGGEGQPPVRAGVEALPNGLFPHMRVKCTSGVLNACWLIPGDIGFNIGPKGLTAADSSLGAEIRFRRLTELLIEAGSTVEVDGEARQSSIAPRVGMHFRTPSGEMELVGLTRGRVEKSGFSPQGWGL